MPTMNGTSNVVPPASTATRPSSALPEMNTLFSAAWFDDAPEKPKEEAAASPAAKGATAAAPAPEKGSSTFLIVALVGGGLLFGAVLCSGIGLGVGAYVYAIGN